MGDVDMSSDVGGVRLRKQDAAVFYELGGKIHFLRSTQSSDRKQRHIETKQHLKIFTFIRDNKKEL